jgi:micrococcal nuclease
MYEYKAKLLKVIDGDTADLQIDVGFQMTTIQRVRLLRINTPEMKGETREAAIRAKSYLEGLLKLRDGDYLAVRTEKDDAFGRYLAELCVVGFDGQSTNVNQSMLDAGMAVEYRR